MSPGQSYHGSCCSPIRNLPLRNTEVWLSAVAGRVLVDEKAMRGLRAHFFDGLLHSQNTPQLSDLTHPNSPPGTSK